MKKALILVAMAVMVAMTTSGCALHQAGYKTEPVVVRTTVPPSAPAPKPDPALAQISQKLDVLIDKISTSSTQTAATPAKIIKFQPNRAAANKNDLEKRVARNERQIAQLNKAIALHGQLFLEEEGKYKVAKVGPFKKGSAFIYDKLAQKIQEAVLWGEENGYVPVQIIGYADDDGWAGNQRLSEKRAKNVYHKILFHRKEFRDLKIKVVGYGPSVMFGTGIENRYTIILFRKKQ